MHHPCPASLSHCGPMPLLRRSAAALLLAATGLAPLTAAYAQAPAGPGPGARLREHLATRLQGPAAALPAGVRLLADQPYGPDPRQRMDVYLPAHPAPAADGARAPVIFMVHGGGWRHGGKAMGRVVENKVARWVGRGLVLVSVDYRLLPETPVAQQVQDVALALAHAQQQAAAWGADAQRFILMGHSAGAHLVALINARPALARSLGASPWLGAVALDSAVLDLPTFMRAPHLRLYDEAFGSDPAYWQALSPYHQWTPGAAPLQLVCSTERRDQPCLQAQALARHVRSQGGRAEVLPQPLTHGEINARLGLEGNYTQAVEDFMASLDAQVAQRLGR
ncbi:alpha/beta hydrolase [Comamonas granuli]|uniref:alpha/beta hydrolase n=1 Tax=Comamonas granuli TaxID=290309 RepID=UPI001FE0FB40|nr:alpha/beta hydrolase [Comamonas granuli]